MPVFVKLFITCCSFVDCCGLSELLNTAGDHESESSAGLLDQDPATITTHTAGTPTVELHTVTLHIDGAACHFSSHGETHPYMHEIRM